VVNAIDVSEFPDWGAVSAAMLPLYAKAAALAPDSPVKAQAKRIAAASSDPVRRAEMALQLVEDQVRYLYIGMDGGGYVPAAADLTWSRRFGDCKGKTVLLIALLKELGIDAEPVLVSTDSGDLVAHRLPAMSAFDHVLVRARIGGRTYWLDGTGLGDTRLDRLDTPPYQVGLPVAAGTNDLIPLVPEPLTQPAETVTLALDASAGIDAPAPAKGEMRFNHSNTTQMRMKFSGLSVADREQELRKLWRDGYDFITPTAVSAGVDERTGDYVITMTGTAKMDWYSDVGSRWYEVDRSRLGWKLDIDRDGAIETDAPFAIDFPDYWASRETIKLPAGVSGFKLQGGPVDQQIGGIYAFHRTVGIADGVVTMDSSTRALASELPASKAEQTRTEMSALANGGVYVRVPDDYMATAADIAALQSNKTALSKALSHRGAVHFDRNELTESLADEDAAIAADPANADAHAIRALALAFQHDPKADEAADKAIALDPNQTLAWRAKGVFAVFQKRYEDAEASFSKQVAIDPKDAQALAARASVRIIRAKFQDALADVDSALALAPDLNIRILRAAALAGLDRKEDALAEADRAVAAAPDNEDVRKARAEFRRAFGESALAMADYDALLKQKPRVEYYLDRALLWPASEKAKRAADVEAALRLDPKSAEALRFSAALAIDESDFARAEKAIAALERVDPDSRSIHVLRLQLLEKQNRGRDALQVANSFVAKNPTDAGALNERCWLKATMNIEIETALADCDASLKLAPNSAATLDSRAFTQLRLGALDAAISDYDAALKLAPDLPASLFGRAIARARKGDDKGARADLAQARKLNADIESRFAGFGVTLPPNLTEPAQAGNQSEPTRSH
jgi:tetratricopeptide (TPR) repeat protein